MDRNPGNFQHLPAHLRTLPNSERNVPEQYDPGSLYQPSQPAWMMPTWFSSSGSYQNSLRKPTDLYGQASPEPVSTLKQGDNLSPRKINTDIKPGKARFAEQSPSESGTDLTVQAKCVEGNDVRYQSFSDKSQDNRNIRYQSLIDKSSGASDNRYQSVDNKSVSVDNDKPADSQATQSQIMPPLSICVGKTYGRWKVAQFIFGAEDQEFALHLLDLHDKYCDKCKTHSTATSEPADVRREETTGNKKSGDLNTGAATTIAGSQERHTVGGDAGAQCTVCTQGFSDENSVREHMLTHHDGFVSPSDSSKKVSKKGRKPKENKSLKKPPKRKKETTEKEDKKTPEEPVKEKRTSPRKRKAKPTVPPTPDMIVKMKFRTCRFCVKIFPTLKLMKKHMRTHLKDANYACEFCNKKFSETRYLKQHMAKHTGTLFRCEVCGCGFTHRSNLSRHKLIHTGVKRHQCDVCGKLFSQKNDLQAHNYSHTGHKRYRCDICDKAFMYNSCLRKHKRIHSDVRAYMCDTCGKSFKTASKLNQHTRTHLKEMGTGALTVGANIAQPGHVVNMTQSVSNVGSSAINVGASVAHVPNIGQSVLTMTNMASHIPHMTNMPSSAAHTTNMTPPLSYMGPSYANVGASIPHVPNMGSPGLNSGTHIHNMGTSMGHVSGVGTSMAQMPHSGPPAAHLSSVVPLTSHVSNMTHM